MTAYTAAIHASYLMHCIFHWSFSLILPCIRGPVKNYWDWWSKKFYHRNKALISFKVGSFWVHKVYPYHLKTSLELYFWNQIYLLCHILFYILKMLTFSAIFILRYRKISCEARFDEHGGLLKYCLTSAQNNKISAQYGLNALERCHDGICRFPTLLFWIFLKIKHLIDG